MTVTFAPIDSVNADRLRDRDTNAVLSPQLADGDPPFDDFSEDGGSPRPVCNWEESVCLETPTHCIVYSYEETDDDPPVVELYCKRHYVVYLARFFEMHPAWSPWCQTPIADHFGYCGTIDGIDLP